MNTGLAIGLRDLSVETIARETWRSGVTFLVFSVAAAVSLFIPLPGAASLADIFR